MSRVRKSFIEDGGDEGIGPPERFKFSHTNLHTTAFFPQPSTHGGGPGTLMGHTTHHDPDEEDPELIELERRLNEEVDEDFFSEPRKFNTLQRVIDVLGLQMMDDATFRSGSSELAKTNPAYRQLKAQQQIVEGAIEHMAVIHCADLNGSVIQVGRVARQFSEAVSKVRSLRKQVRDIQDTLGAGHVSATADGGGGGGDGATGASAAGANASNKGARGGSSNTASLSLRELWLKKLECEATLALLAKLDVIRAAPSKFDSYIAPPLCRIGAAVNCLSEALSTMFSDDVAQVQALHKIMEQLMLRKQKAEEMIWDTLHDVIFLRTGNGHVTELIKWTKQHYYDEQESRATRDTNSILASSGPSKGIMSGGHSVSSGSRRSNNRVTFQSHYARNNYNNGGNNQIGGSGGLVNPFVGPGRRYAVEEDINDDDENGDSHSVLDSIDGSGDASTWDWSDDETVDQQSAAGGAGGGGVVSPTVAASRTSGSGAAGSGGHGASKLTSTKVRMMIPLPMIEAELDLEEDERRCLEEIALSTMANSNGARFQPSYHYGGGRKKRERQLPRYAEPVLATRILVECLAKLKRLDDVERVLAEGLEREIQMLIKREQGRTFARLERLRRKSIAMGGTGSSAGGGPPSGSGSSSMINATLVVVPSSALSDRQHEERLKEFRAHLTGMLSAFGSVMIRLSHLAEILRHRVTGDKELMQQLGSPSSIMRPVLSSALDIMQREIKMFLKACLREQEIKHDPMDASRAKGSSAYETGLFSLGIVETHEKKGSQSVSATTRGHVMELTTTKFVTNIMLPMVKVEPEVRNALTFRRSIAKFTAETEALKKELAALTYEDTSAPSYNFSPEESAISFLDNVIQKELLPVLQEEAVNGTVKSLERPDAFDPVLDRTLYARPNSNEPQDVDMCKACQAMYNSTGPLFLALHRLPPGGEMYLPLVAVLEHVMLTFISRVKQQVGRICNRKTAFALISDEDQGSFSKESERRRPYQLLLRAYADGDLLETGGPGADELGKSSGLMPLSPPTSDTTPRQSIGDMKVDGPMEELADGVEGEEMALEQELKSIKEYFDFDDASISKHPITCCNDEELMKAACLAHSLLKLASLLESRLKVRGGYNKTLTSTRTLQEAIKTIKRSGVQMSKFCRLDILCKTISKMSKVPTSSTIVARDAVRIPSSVNDLGETLMQASDNLREAAGNAVAAYAFSSLEQYIPYCLMQAVRVVAAGRGVVQKQKLSLNGIEALDRSGSVLYRDLKGATSFDNSFWDVELAAVSFERSASFIAMLELEMEELIQYYSANQDDFSEEDFKLMFAMTGPRRRGDINQYNMLKRRQNQ